MKQVVRKLSGERTFCKRTLKNGVRVVSEKIPHVRSVAVGLCLDVGSREETPLESGIAHVIEHMFFKGTAKRNVLEIATEINNLGGNANAFTSQEMIVLHSKVIDEQLGRVFDLLADLLCNSLFSDTELERERNVILEEIRMYEDTPDEQVIDNFTEALWRGSALGRPVLGRPQNIRRFKRRNLAAFMAKHFSPERLVISVAGNFDRKQLNRLVDGYFSDFGSGGEARQADSPVPVFRNKEVKRPLEQAHFCLGSEGPARNTDDRFAYSLMNLILGGGMNSRIFQEVREKRGLAYSVGSMQRPYRDTGYFAVTGGVQPKNLTAVTEVILGEIRRMHRESVSAEELQSAKEAFKGSVLLSLENTSVRMSRLADLELYFGRFIPIDEVMRKMNAVNVSQIQRVAEQHLKDRPVSISVIGPESLKIKGKTSLNF